MVGCFRADDIKVISTPTPGLSFTEQTYRGRGAIDNDYTHIYAHLDGAGKSSKMAVLSGTYVVLNRILWSSPNEAILCMQPGGFTDEFHSQVTLQAKDNESITIHFLLKEDC